MNLKKCSQMEGLLGMTFSENREVCDFLILLPIKNESQNILSCLDSINNQTKKSWHLFIQDNCSNDDTYQRCLDYSVIYPNITVLQTRSNVPVLENWESLAKFAVTRVDSKYVVWMAGDDSWQSNDLLEKADQKFSAEKDLVAVAPNFNMSFSPMLGRKNYMLSLKFTNFSKSIRLVKFLAHGAVATHLTYAVYRRRTFEEILSSKLGELRSDAAADWFWSLATVLNGKVGNISSIYIKNHNFSGAAFAQKVNLPQAGLKNRFLTFFSNFELNFHVYRNWHRVKMLNMSQSIIFLSFFLIRDIGNLISLIIKYFRRKMPKRAY